MSYQAPAILPITSDLSTRRRSHRSTAGLREPDSHGKVLARRSLGAVKPDKLPPEIIDTIAATIEASRELYNTSLSDSQNSMNSQEPQIGLELLPIATAQRPGTSPGRAAPSPSLQSIRSTHSLLQLGPRISFRYSDDSQPPAPATSTSPPLPLQLTEFQGNLIGLLQQLHAQATSRDAAEGAEIFAEWLEKAMPSIAENGAAEGSTLATAPTMQTMGNPAAFTPVREEEEGHETPASPRFSSCYVAIKTILCCGYCNTPISLGTFHPTIYEATTFGASVFYGAIYGVLSNFKASVDLGDALAGTFSLFSAVSNFAQIFLTIRDFPADLRKKFNELNSYITRALTCCLPACCSTTFIERVSQGLTMIITAAIGGLSIFTASSLASATFAATGSQTLSYIMWAFRSALVFKSSIGIIGTLHTLLTQLVNTIQEVRNGDKALLRALIETGFIGLSAYIATQYSLSQEQPMGEFAASNLEGIFSSFGVNLNDHQAMLGGLGLGPLLALNICFIMGGAKMLVELCDRYHPTLLLALFLSAPTGFPGVALIGNPDLLSTLIAYLSAVLSNDASIAKLSYITEKREKDLLIMKLEQTSLNLAGIRAEADKRLGTLKSNEVPDASEIQKMADLIFNCDTLTHTLANVINELKAEPTTTLEKAAETATWVNTKIATAACCSGPHGPDSATAWWRCTQTAPEERVRLLTEGGAPTQEYMA